MSVATRLLRELTEEGVDLARGTVRWIQNRFGGLPETAENVARARAAVNRVQPRLPSQGRDPFAVPVERMQRAAQRRTVERPLAARPQPQRPLAVQPAAEQPLALPAPAEPLPEWAAKPRGGQWIAQGVGGLGALSPEQQVLDSIHLTERYQSGDPLSVAMREWWDRALPRYIRNDFATPTDPLRDIAPQAGLAADADAWSDRAKQTILPFPVGAFTLPNDVASADGGLPGASGSYGEVRRAMPWLARQPVTDSVYAVDLTAFDGLNRDFSHVADELRNAMRPEISGIPADLAVRPESLQRMSFPQAVERVGRINQWRAAQEAEASLAAQNNPALRTYREYAENNPQGFRWVEIAAPEVPMPEGALIRPVEGWDDMIEIVDPRTGMQLSVGATEQEARRLLAREEREQQLQDALTYEGDTMGHCVGGYCDDVLSGRARIFSLRDAQGQPFVTVETRPGRPRTALSEIPRDALDQITEAATADTNAVAGPMGIGPDDPRWTRTYQTNLALKQREWLSANPTPDDIIQIKGSGKRQGQQQLRLSSRGYEGGPDDYLLPFVQDFVRQGQWGNVGDLGNAGLVRLPDGRYITSQQRDEALAAAAPAIETRWSGGVPPNYAAIPDFSRLDEDDWANIAPYFEGYAIGGRVDPDRCFCRHPFSAKR